MNVIVDSCFWFALYDPSDEHHNKAIRINEKLKNVKLIIPFPSLYEVINTRFSKSKNLILFKNRINSSECICVPDEKYKEDALRTTFFFSLEKEKKRPISLVDMILRFMMEDVDLQIKGLITFNDGDFEDVCRKKNIEILYP